jgi:tRNA-modifying protein YgfZ
MPNAIDIGSEPVTRLDLSDTQPPLGVLRAVGVDSGKFLQGQLSADVSRLQVGESTIAGLHNREGRVFALLRVVVVTSAEILAVLPRELVTETIARLQKYILRSKTSLQDASDQLVIFGSWHRAASSPDCVARLPWGASREISICARTNDWKDSGTASAATRRAWAAADIAEGIPQVYRVTSEAFVSQMLNLDVLGAIAFDKGCYTGQEVIARAHYRGRVKRRMRRFRERRKLPHCRSTG